MKKVDLIEMRTVEAGATSNRLFSTYSTKYGGRIVILGNATGEFPTGLIEIDYTKIFGLPIITGFSLNGNGPGFIIPSFNFDLKSIITGLLARFNLLDFPEIP